MNKSEQILDEFLNVLTEFGEVSNVINGVDFSRANPMDIASFIFAISELSRAIKKVNATSKNLIVLDSIRKWKNENE